MTRGPRQKHRIAIGVVVGVHIVLQVYLSGLLVQSSLSLHELLDLAVVLLLALIWRGSWVKFLADPTEQKRDVFYAFTAVNLRQYLDLLVFGQPALEITADFLSLTTVYLMLRSQAKTILLPPARQQWVQRFYVLCSVLIFGLGILSQIITAVAVHHLYMLVFTGSHLVILAILFYWYFMASVTSTDVLVTWRFRFLVIGATAYFSMFLFNMFASLLGWYELPDWDVIHLSIKTGLIVIGLHGIYLAFSMGSNLAKLLVKISARRGSMRIWDDLILLAMRLSDIVAANPGNIVSFYAMSIARKIGLPEFQCEVLRSAGNTAYFLWHDELPELRLPVALTVAKEEAQPVNSSAPDWLFAAQLLHLQAVSQVLQAIDEPYHTRCGRTPIEARILQVVLDYLRFGSLDRLQMEKGKKYDADLVDALARIVAEAEAEEALV